MCVCAESFKWTSKKQKKCEVSGPWKSRTETSSDACVCEHLVNPLRLCVGTLLRKQKTHPHIWKHTHTSAIKNHQKPITNLPRVISFPYFYFLLPTRTHINTQTQKCWPLVLKKPQKSYLWLYYFVLLLFITHAILPRGKTKKSFYKY